MYPETMTVNKKLVAVGAVVFLLVTMFGIYAMRQVLMPFIIAFGIAYLLNPLIDRMEKWGVNRTLAIVILMTLLATALAGILAFIIPLLWSQVEYVATNIPNYAETVRGKVMPFIEKLPPLDRAKVEEAIREALGLLGDLPLKILKGISATVWSGFSGAMRLFIALFNIVIIPVATFYLLNDFEIITKNLATRIPTKYRERTVEFVGKIDTVLSALLRGQLTVALILSTIYAAGLFFIGAPMGLFIGIVAGISNFVPYLPIVTGFIPAAALAYLHFGDWQHPVMVAVLFAVGQTLEGIVLTPRALERTVGLHPVTVMAALLVGGSLFGFIGILLAMPAAAAFKVALGEIDRIYMESDFYKQPD